MTGFFIGLASGILLAAVVAVVLILIRRRRVAKGTAAPARDGYRKVMVASVGRPFNERAVALGSSLGRTGVVVTLYVIEIPLNMPLESGAEKEIAEGMEALESSARIGAAAGVRPLPRIERSRLASKTIIDIQRKDGFDAVVLSVQPGRRSEREGNKIADYIQEHASCPVFVVSEPSPDE